MPEFLKDSGLEDPQINGIIISCRKQLAMPFVVPPMPVQDAIELAHYLVATTSEFSRFSPGATTVGAPIEIGAITKHEGFKWIPRKHYFDTQLNPLED